MRRGRSLRFPRARPGLRIPTALGAGRDIGAFAAHGGGPTDPHRGPPQSISDPARGHIYRTDRVVAFFRSGAVPLLRDGRS